MNIKSTAGGASAAALVLALALGASACGGRDDNANNSNASNANTRANTNANAVTTATATPSPVSTSEDTAIKNKAEANLSKAGVTGVTVTVEGGVVTLKGDVPKAKLQDAVKAANEAGAKRVMNQITTK